MNEGQRITEREVCTVASSVACYQYSIDHTSTVIPPLKVFSILGVDLGVFHSFR